MGSAAPARERWLEAHPYLAPIADFQQVVSDAAGAPAPLAAPPSFDAYAPDYAAGVPLLQSGRVALDVVPAAAQAVEALLVRLAASPLPEPVRLACHDLRERHARAPEERDRAIRRVLAGCDEDSTPHAGVLRFLGWKALGAVLAPVLRAFEAWRDDGAWGRPHCPVCGALPVMARLAAGPEGRQRLLSCGCCGTRWRYKRIGCPYCGNEKPDKLDAFEVSGEEGFRLDACQECKGYTKTWTGEGDEALLLADWPTLHLDVLAKQQGLARLGASLYDL